MAVPPTLDSILANFETGDIPTQSQFAEAWTASYNQQINVIDYGADPTGANDSTAEIQQALDSGTPYVSLGIGQYRIDSSITIPGGVSLVGERAELLYSGSGVAVISNCMAGVSTSDGRVRSRIEGFAIRSTVALDRATTGLWLRDSARCIVDRVSIRGFGRGIDTSGASWSAIIKDCWLFFNVYGVYNGATDTAFIEPGQPGYNGSADYSGFNGGILTSCEIQGNYVGVFYKLYPESDGLGSKTIASGSKVIDNIIEGNFGAGIALGSNNTGTAIQRNYFEVNCSAAQLDPTTTNVLLWKTGQTVSIGDIRWAISDQFGYEATSAGTTAGDDSDLAGGSDTGVSWVRKAWTQFGEDADFAEVVNADIVLASKDTQTRISKIDISANSWTSQTAFCYYVDRASGSVKISQTSSVTTEVLAAQQRSADFGVSATGFIYDDNERGFTRATIIGNALGQTTRAGNTSPGLSVETTLDGVNLIHTVTDKDGTISTYTITPDP